MNATSFICFNFQFQHISPTPERDDLVAEQLPVQTYEIIPPHPKLIQKGQGEYQVLERNQGVSSGQKTDIGLETIEEESTMKNYSKLQLSETYIDDIQLERNMAYTTTSAHS